MMLTPGIKGQAQAVVCKENTAFTMKSGSLEVFATPAMIALMEEASVAAVAPFLEDGTGTVGTKLNVDHLAATPVGMTVTCVSTLEEVDGRRLVFSVEASDEKGLIGKGVHERFVINNEKFMQKALKKAEKE